MASVLELSNNSDEFQLVHHLLRLALNRNGAVKDLAIWVLGTTEAGQRYANDSVGACVFKCARFTLSAALMVANWHVPRTCNIIILYTIKSLTHSYCFWLSLQI